MQSFVLDRHQQLVFPSNSLPYLEFSVSGSESQAASVIRRDFENKAPKGTDIRERIRAGRYASRYEQDIALNLAG